MTIKAATVKHHLTYDGAILNIFHVNKGEGLPRHNHSYAHLIMCHAGSCRVSNARTSIVVTKDTQPINLVAGDWHELEALEDGTVFVTVFAEGKNT